MSDAWTREREIHDQLAAELDASRMPRRMPDELERHLLDQVGDIRGKRLLELGCGAGDLTLELAAAGAVVTALDISPGMVAVARSRVERLLPDARVEFVVGPAETIAVSDESFDLIVGKWILHHADLERLVPEVSRLLARGGRAVFIENSGRNPLLRFARNHVTGRFGVRRVGTPDEHPLLRADLERFQRAFRRVDCSYPQFDFMRLLDRQIFRFRRPLVTRTCNAIDDFVQDRVPPLRRYSFRVIVELSDGV